MLKLQEFWLSPACAASWHWPSDRALWHLIRHHLARATTISGLHWELGRDCVPSAASLHWEFQRQAKETSHGSALKHSSHPLHTQKKFKTINELPYPFPFFFFQKKTNKQTRKFQTKQAVTNKKTACFALMKSLVSFRKYTNLILNGFEHCLPPAFLKRMDVASNIKSQSATKNFCNLLEK